MSTSPDVARDNNLNLIRLLAAGMVLVSYSHVLSSGRYADEPWLGTLGMSPGGVAVDLFFVVSGFLVMSSLLRNASIWNYVLARAFRIYPALWVALLLSALVVEAGFSTLSMPDFLRDPQTWKYLAKNAVMITGGEANLPGAFTTNPFADAVNGSLWTLRYELRLYALLALLWWGVRAIGRGGGQPLMAPLMLGLAVVLTLASLGLPLWNIHSDFISLGAVFFTGAACCCYRERLSLDTRWLPWACGAVLTGALVSVQAFDLVYRLAMPWLLFYLAFVPAGGVRSFNRFGDYSYGVYIYAFPVQQMLAATTPGLGIWPMTALATVITLPLAMASWHLIEKPALALRSRWQHRTRLANPVAKAAR